MEVYFDNLTAKNARLDTLAAEVELLVQDAEKLVQTGSSTLPDHERQRLSEILSRLKSTAGQIKLQATKGLKAADRVVRDHPYESVGVAVALGLLVGALIGRSRCSGRAE